jgi:hypothetical protein
MKPPLILIQAFALCVVFVAVDLIARVAVPIPHTGQSHLPIWTIAPNAIVAFTMASLASRARWRGWRLAFALSAVPLAIGVINVVEGAVYLKSEIGQPWWILTFLAAKYVLVLPLWPLISRGPSDRRPIVSGVQARTIGSMLWRLMLCDILYLVFYFIAGIFIFPLVREFYEARPMPSIGQIVVLQLLLRGPVFTGICVLLVRMIDAPRVVAALAAGLAFTLISGVAPLIAPNSFFPDAVRWIHFCEVTGSNFLFGIAVAWIWSRKPIATQPSIASPEAILKHN